LVKEDIYIRVVDIFSVKPFDKVTLRRCAEETGRVLVVEDHYGEGGIGGIIIFINRNCYESIKKAQKHSNFP
jgi:transketolase